jgi:hypothetical protein
MLGKIAIAIVDGHRHSPPSQRAPGLQAGGNVAHRHGMIVAAKVCALLLQIMGLASGKPMVHEDPQTVSGCPH